MFTGIVQGLCPVRRVVDDGGLRHLTIDVGALSANLDLGASVAINGVCLTVTDVTGNLASFDVIRESRDRSNLDAVKMGDHVNVERSLKFGDEIGGHVLSGHVACTVVVVRIEAGVGERTLWLKVPVDWMRYLSLKGFVALDGASLTIAALNQAASELAVSLIPETIARTTLGTCVIGARINLEVDAQTQTIVDTVERLMADRFAESVAGS